MVNQLACPDVSELRRLVAGDLSVPELDTLVGHLEGCDSCLARVQTLAPVDTLDKTLAKTRVQPHGPDDAIVARLIAKLKSMPSAAAVPIAFTCGGCMKQLKVKTELAGKRVKCPGCGQITAVPVPPAAEHTMALPGSDTAAVSDTGDQTAAEKPAVESEAWDFLAPSQAADEIGRLGSYRVLKVLGRGGMGVVFRAEDPFLKRVVALKAMLPTLAASPSAKKRFIREAQTAASIKHDHIVTIHQVGEDRGAPFLAMEFLHGEPLDVRLKRESKLPIHEVLRLGREVAEGLAAAHEAGLIHRDIKPANVWLETRPSGASRVKILDFGLARSTDDQAGITQAGAIVGTPAYMAPEQAQGVEVDQRCDLFSLGVMLYVMATGQQPFRGKDTMSTLMSVAMDTAPAPQALNPDMPVELSDYILRLLAKKPDERPGTAAEVAKALHAMEFRPQIVAPAPVAVPLAIPMEPTEPTESMSQLDFDVDAPTNSSARKPAAARAKPRRPVAVAIAIGLVVLALGAAAAQFIFSTKDGTLYVEVDDEADVRFKNGRLEVRDEKGELKYTLEPGDKNRAVAPGKYFVKVTGADGVKLETETFEMDRKGKAFVRVRAGAPVQVAGKEPKKDPPGKNDPVKPVGPGGTVTVPPFVPGTPLALRKPTWTPGPADNILPGIVSRPAILDAFGRWQIVPTAVPHWGVSLSPDGKWAAAHDDTALRLYDANTGAFVKVFLLNKGQSVGQSMPAVEWSPDSRWMKWGTRRPTGVSDGLTFAALDAAVTPTAKFETSANLDFGWSPKHNVAAWVPHSTNDRIAIVDPTLAKPIEVVVKVGVVSGAWSPDGEKLLVVLADKTGVLVGRDGKVGAQFAAGFECNVPGVGNVPPAWSADGKVVAAPTADGAVGFWNADGTAGKKTGKHEKPIHGLHWKPDGKLLAVTVTEGGCHFWKPDGTSEWSVDTRNYPGFVWAKDGKGFFTPGKFWPAVGNPSFTNLLLAPNTVAIPSPDQKSVALPKRGEIAVLEWKDGETKDIGWKVAQPQDGIPAWSPDGKRLAVFNMNGTALYDGHDPKKVVWLGGGSVVGNVNKAAFSPKGDRMAVATSAGSVLICEPTGKPLRVISIPPDPNLPPWAAAAAADLQWHPDGKHLAVSSGITSVTVFDTETGTAFASTSVHGHRPGGGSAIFSPANPDHLLIANPDGSALWRWKVEKEPLQKFPGFGKLVPSPDGKKLLSLTIGSGIHGNEYLPPQIVSLDLKDRDPAGLKDFVAKGNHPGQSLAWHPNGQHLVVTRDGERRDITIRWPNGTVVETVKPDGVDVTWLEWVTPVIQGYLLVGRNGQGPDHYLFDLTAKKLTPFGKVNGELTASPDGKHLIALEGSTMTYWNVDTKAVEQKVVLLPSGEFITLGVAGEVLEKSANAENYFRYAIEDKSGNLIVKTPAEMAASLPKSAAVPPVVAKVRWPLQPTPAEEIKFFHDIGLMLKTRDATGDGEIRPGEPVPDKPLTVVGANFWDADATKVNDELMRRLAKLTDLEALQYNFKKSDGLSVTTAGGREIGALVNLRRLDVCHLFKGGFDGVVLAKLRHLEVFEVGGIAGSVWVPHAAGLPALREINCYLAPITEPELLDQLGKLQLRAIRFHHPGVSADVLKAFAKKQPWCLVSASGVAGVDGTLTIEPTAPPPAAPVGAAPLDPAWLKAVAAMPAEKQVEAVVAELKKRNPEFVFETKDPAFADGNRYSIEDGAVVELRLKGKFADASPVRALPGLKRLWLGSSELKDFRSFRGLKVTELRVQQSPVTDLSPLAELPLKSLTLYLCPQLADLTPLKGMPLESFSCRSTRVADITPLKGMKLKFLDLTETDVKDLRAVEGMPLESFCGSNFTTDLTPLKGMRLKSLQCRDVSDLTPLKGMPLEELWVVGGKATDLTPVKDAPLMHLVWENYEPKRDREILLSIKTLERINHRPAKEILK